MLKLIDNIHFFLQPVVVRIETKADGFVDMIKARHNGDKEEREVAYDNLMKSCIRSKNDHSYLFLECFRELQRGENDKDKLQELYLYWIGQTMELDSIKCFICIISQIKNELSENYQLEKNS